jgi:hypothetical protein
MLTAKLLTEVRDLLVEAEQSSDAGMICDPSLAEIALAASSLGLIEEWTKNHA